MEIGSAMPGAPGVSEEVPAPAVASQTATANPARAHEPPPPETDDHPHFDVTLPSWRLDLQREIDLIEEVARVHGYNRFRNTLPAFAGAVRPAPEVAAVSAARETLLAAGWSEAISSTFCSEADAKLTAARPDAAARMENPLSEEAGMLRPSLVPGMLAMLAHNLHRGVEDCALFELGNVFLANGSAGQITVSERPSLAFGAFGGLQARAVDFATAKGLVEALARRFTSRMLYFDRFPPELGLMPAWLHPGRSARLVMDGSTIGFFGQLHPEEAVRRKLRAAVLLGELRFERLLTLGLRHPLPRELSRFQPVRRDFSLLLPEGVAWSAVEEAVRGLRIPELQSAVPAEVLRGSDAEYSLLLRTVFQSAERTLREDELQGWSRSLEQAMQVLGGRLRS